MTPTPTPPPPSPTGEAVFKLPPWLAWLLVGLSAASATVSQLPVLVKGFNLDPRLAACALLLSIALGAMGIVSAGGRKVVALIVVLGATLAATGAAAQTISVGPSLPAFEITPGAAHPATVAAGMGVRVDVDLFPTVFVGQKSHWMNVGFDAFGSAVPDGKVSGSAALGLHVCVLDSFCVGGGVRLLATDGTGALDGKLDHRSFFILFEPDCRVLKLLWPALAAPEPAPTTVDQPVDGDHPNGPDAVQTDAHQPSVAPPGDQ